MPLRPPPTAWRWFLLTALAITGPLSASVAEPVAPVAGQRDLFALLMDDRPWADAVPAGAAHLTLGTAADGLVLLAVVLAACAVAWRLGARAAGCPLCGRAFEADHHPAVEDRPAAQVRALRRVR